jgi:hypothetical protein
MGPKWPTQNGANTKGVSDCWWRQANCRAHWHQTLACGCAAASVASKLAIRRHNWFAVSSLAAHQILRLLVRSEHGRAGTPGGGGGPTVQRVHRGRPAPPAAALRAACGLVFAEAAAAHPVQHSTFKRSSAETLKHPNYQALKHSSRVASQPCVSVVTNTNFAHEAAAGWPHLMDSPESNRRAMVGGI